MRYLAVMGFTLVLCAQIPKTLEPPKEQQLLFHLQGKGSQVYTCKNTDGKWAWVFKAPDAKLLGEGDTPAGRHFAGPTWESTDGSQVKGKVAASVPSPDANSIPWLLLTAVSHQGQGVMSKVESIQRIATTGGTKPSEVCNAASDQQEKSVPYEATYNLYGSQPANQ